MSSNLELMRKIAWNSKPKCEAELPLFIEEHLEVNALMIALQPKEDDETDRRD